MMDLGNDGHKEVVRMEFNKANTACCWNVRSSLPLGFFLASVGSSTSKTQHTPCGRDRGLSDTEVEYRQTAG